MMKRTKIMNMDKKMNTVEKKEDLKKKIFKEIMMEREDINQILR